MKSSGYLLSIALSLKLAIISSLPLMVGAGTLNILSEKAVASGGEVLQAQAPFNPQRLNTPGSNRQGRAVRFKPPHVGLPSIGRQQAATRGDTCSTGKKSLTALIPEENIGLTVAAYPTFFVYVPQTSNQLEFVLLDEKDDDIYKTTFTPPRTPGIASIHLPNNGSLPPLKTGKRYHWYLSVICDANNREDDLSVDGWIQRTQITGQLASNLAKASGRAIVVFYAEAGIWYDALSNLVNLRRKSPNDATLVADWASLLQSVRLDQFSNETLVD